MRTLSCLLISLLLVSCSGQTVLQPQGEPAFDNTPESAALQNLKGILGQLNYEGIGIAYESDSTIELLTRVFSNPRSHKKEIRLFYTGLALAYDPKSQSLTIGGTDNPEKIVQFIVKNIPKRKSPQSEIQKTKK